MVPMVFRGQAFDELLNYVRRSRFAFPTASIGKKSKMLEETLKGFGWIPDLPDSRDLTATSPIIREMLKSLGKARATLPEKIDLRSDGDGKYFSAARDQRQLNSSAAFACLAAVEYFMRRISGEYFEGSVLFLYQTTRFRIQRSVPVFDGGADLRSTLKVLTQVGVPPEKFWPYQTARFYQEPGSFVCSTIKPLSHIHYFRLFTAQTDWTVVWPTIRAFLTAGFPIIFGFSVPDQLDSPDILYRYDLDAPQGGQCAVAIGYQINRYGPQQHGICFRSSWGNSWGEDGNGWLPVSCLRHCLATDFWCLLSKDWLHSNELTQPDIEI